MVIEKSQNDPVNTIQWSGHETEAQVLAKDATQRGLFPHAMRRPTDWTTDGIDFILPSRFPCPRKYPEVCPIYSDGLISSVK